MSRTKRDADSKLSIHESESLTVSPNKEIKDFIDNELEIDEAHKKLTTIQESMKKVPPLTLTAAPSTAGRSTLLERSSKFANFTCEYCGKSFSMKAGTRHIEHCREMAKRKEFIKKKPEKNPPPEG